MKRKKLEWSHCWVSSLRFITLRKRNCSKLRSLRRLRKINCSKLRRLRRIKKNKDCIDETFKRHLEWYIPTSDTTKSFILHILYVVKDFFRSNYKKEPTRSEIKTKITELSDVNFHFTKDIEELHWDKLRGFTKAMWHKFKKDKDNHKLEKYSSYVRHAQAC